MNNRTRVQVSGYFEDILSLKHSYFHNHPDQISTQGALGGLYQVVQ